MPRGGTLAVRAHFDLTIENSEGRYIRNKESILADIASQIEPDDADDRPAEAVTPAPTKQRVTRAESCTRRARRQWSLRAIALASRPTRARSPADEIEAMMPAPPRALYMC